MPDLQKQLLLYNGYDQVPVNDYTTDTDWQQTELSNNASNGDGATSTWVVDVPDGDVPDHRGATGTKYISSHNRLKLFVGSNTIWRGRDSGKGVERGPTRGTRPQEWHVTESDPNAELNGMVVHNWVRGEETDVARAQALAAAYLNGSPRPSTVLNASTYVVTGSNTVTFPAKTYTAVTPAEVLQELARQTDKDMFVDVDDNLHYHGHDYTGFDSPLRISDDLADLNANTLLPIEPKMNEEGLDQLTVLRSYYGPDEVQDSVQVTDNTHLLTTDYWEEAIFDDESVTAAQALVAARQALAPRRLDQISYTVRVGMPGVIQAFNSTPMTGDFCYMLKAGMRIQFKARAARGGIANNGSRIGDSFQTVHIREVRWTFPGPDQYYADLVLERPIRRFSGRTQPKATTPRPPTPGTGDPPTYDSSDAENGENDNSLQVDIDLADGTNVAFVAWTVGENTPTSVAWDRDGTGGGANQAFTKVGTTQVVVHTQGFSYRATCWVLFTPLASTHADSRVYASFNGSQANAFGVQVIEDVDTAGSLPTPVWTTGIGTTSSLTIPATANQIALNFVGWMRSNTTPSDPTIVAGQTESWSLNFNNSAGRGDIAHGAGYGDATPGWTFSSSQEWLAGGLALNGTGTPGDAAPQTVRQGAGDTGSAGTYMPIDTQIEAGLLSSDGEHYFDAADIEYEGSASGIGVDNVQEAIDALDEAVDALESGESVGGDFIAGALSNPPTEAEVEAVIGSPGAAAHGTVFGLQDSGTEKRYLAITDGVQWHTVPLVTPPEQSTVAALTAAPAGGWAQTHSAHYYNGITYFAYVRGDNGNVELRTYTHSTNTVSAATVMHAALLADTHAAPSLVVRQSDHRIHAFYSDHAGAAQYQWISTNPEDISAGTETNIDAQLGGTGYTYPMVADLTSGLYLFVRYSGGAAAGQDWGYAVTTDDGTTWSALTKFYEVTARTAYPFGNKTGDDRVDFMAIDGSSLEANDSIQFFSFDAAGNEWTAADGTVLTLPVGDQTEIVVWDGAAGDDARGRFEVQRGLDDHPRILHASINGATYTYRHERWTGTAWVATALLAGTEPSGQASACFDSLDTNILYLVDASNEIRRLTTLDEVTWASETLTTATTSLYPLSPVDHAPDLPVLWMAGTFTDAATYSVGTIGFGASDAAAANDNLQRIVFMDDTVLDELIVKRTSGGVWQFSRNDGSSWENVSGAAALDDLTDVTITAATLGDMLRYNGTVWVNTPGRWEVVVSGTAPPVAVSNPDDDDWLFAWVNT